MLFHKWFSFLKVTLEINPQKIKRRGPHDHGDCHAVRRRTWSPGPPGAKGDQFERPSHLKTSRSTIGNWGSTVPKMRPWQMASIVWGTKMAEYNDGLNRSLNVTPDLFFPIPTNTMVAHGSTTSYNRLDQSLVRLVATVWSSLVLTCFDQKNKNMGW